MTGPLFTFPNPDGSIAEVGVTIGPATNVATGTTTATVPVVLDYGYTPAPPPVPMLVGSDAATVDLAKYPRLAYSRRFNGAKFPVLTGVPAQVRAHVSISSLPTQADVATFVAANPGRGGWFTIKHEVNTGKKGTPAQFQADNAALDRMFDMTPGAAGWLPVEIYGLYAQVHAAKNGLPDWSAYHTSGNVAGAPVAIGWDCYRDASTTSYPAPADFFAPCLAARDESGLPFMVPELGSPQLASDTTGAGLADWYAACVDYLRTVGCLAVAAWDEVGSQFNYSLTGTPLWAWRRMVATQ